MQKIWDTLKAIYDFIVGFPQFVFDLVVKVITSVFLMLKDVFFWVLEQLLNLALSAINAMDFSAINEAASWFGSVPADMVNILSLCGVGYCLGLIAASLVIRFLLQLIPFVRLGS